MKNLLITGSGGYIGSSFVNYINKFHKNDFCLTTISRSGKANFNIDLSNKYQLKKVIDIINPDIVLHLAAFVNPKKNEENIEKSKLDNFVATKNLIDLTKDQNPIIVFASTDKVYDGINIKPKEDESLNPTFTYGKMKLQSENYITDNIKNYFIFRVPIVHGFGETTNSFIDKSLNDLKNNMQVRSFKNIYRCYINLNDLNRLFVYSFLSNKYGIYNCGTSAQSYYERIKNLCKLLNIDTSKLIPEIGEVHPISQDLNLDKIYKNFEISFQ